MRSMTSQRARRPPTPPRRRPRLETALAHPRRTRLRQRVAAEQCNPKRTPPPARSRWPSASPPCCVGAEHRSAVTHPRRQHLLQLPGSQPHVLAQHRHPPRHPRRPVPRRLAQPRLRLRPHPAPRPRPDRSACPQTRSPLDPPRKNILPHRRRKALRRRIRPQTRPHPIIWVP